MKPTLRTLHPEVRVVDAKQGLVDYVASDESLDCYREIIRANGWKFDRFAANPVFVDSHDYSCIEKQLGRVVDYKVDKGQLIERVQWAVDVDQSLAPLVHLGWQMTVKGYLKAVSVGFFPERTASKWDADQSTFIAQVTELKLTPEQAAQVACVYMQQQQIELSACIIGANPNALAKAHKDGAVGDADLAALGFDDDAMTFLHEAAAGYEKSDPLVRRLLDRELRTLTSLSLSQRKTTQPAVTRAAAGRVKERRASVLKEFKKTLQISSNNPTR